ncbi:MAG: hypothetical protein Q9209_001520 [Squamulea sp. 1 TL-2023]
MVLLHNLSIVQHQHERQGPIVRISPYELHINDPEYYDELYVGSTRRSEEYPWTTKQFGPRTSVFATTAHELHRIRRAALAPFFSMQSVQRLEPSVQPVIDKLISRLQELQGSGKVVNMLREQVIGVKKDLADGKRPTSQMKKNVFHDMIPNPAVRPEEKTTDHLVLEAVSVIAAGMNTTAFCLATITYYLLQNPEKLERLQSELAGIAGVNEGKPGWQTIEKLPYLGADALAYCELYLTLFAVFCPSGGNGGKGFEFELLETGEKDVVIARDFFNAVPNLDSKGIRIVVK